MEFSRQFIEPPKSPEVVCIEQVKTAELKKEDHKALQTQYVQSIGLKIAPKLDEKETLLLHKEFMQNNDIQTTPLPLEPKDVKVA